MDTPRELVTPAVKLERLYRDMQYAEQRLYRLRYKRRMVKGSGNSNGPLGMLIVEQPELNDENIGVAITGPSAILLKRILEVVDLKRADHLFVTAVCKWRLPAVREPSVEETALLLPWLQEEIDIVKPRYILTSGRYVNRLFFPRRKHHEILGDVLLWRNNRFVLPTVALTSAIHGDMDGQRQRGQLLSTFRMLAELDGEP